MNKHTFLITSAIYTNYGIYSAQDRIKQTIDTAKSVRKYVPNSTIILVDNSKVDVQSDESPEFEELLDLVDYYIDNSDDNDIKYFHSSVSNYDIGKNSMEVLGFIKALQHIAADEELLKVINDSTRVFKLSGRYELTDKFSIDAFDNDTTKDHYVFKQSQPSWCDQNVTGVDQLLQTRLWSFTPSLLGETIAMFQQIVQNMFDTYNKQQYIDVEHSMYKFIDRNKLLMVDTVGLKGNIAPNGMIIID
jgi:hypothetical protein